MISLHTVCVCGSRCYRLMSLQSGHMEAPFLERRECVWHLALRRHCNRPEVTRMKPDILAREQAACVE